MEDIIAKLSGKDRKHKVSVKRKFIEVALDQEASGAGPESRAAQVFVVVINREKDYDPVISQKMSLKLLQKRPRGAANKKNDGQARPAQPRIDNLSSSEDEAKQEELNKSRRLRGIRKSELAGSTVASSAGKYASDSEFGGATKKGNIDRLSSANTSSTQPKLIKASVEASANKQITKPFRPV